MIKGDTSDKKEIFKSKNKENKMNKNSTLMNKEIPEKYISKNTKDMQSKITIKESKKIKKKNIEIKCRKNILKTNDEFKKKGINSKDRKSTPKLKKSPKRERSREKSLKKEELKSETMIPKAKINIPIFDDSKSEDLVTIENYINNKKKELQSNKISLSDYIKKVDVDNEQIFKYLENMLNDNINKFFQLYKKEFFKLTLDQRIKIQNKILEIKNIQIPDIIKKNFVQETKIENIFYNILSSLIDIKKGTKEKINDVFIKNNVYFEEKIDLIIPYKYGVKELQFYCLLNDLFFYFQNGDIDLNKKYSIFLKLKMFITHIKEIKENLILKCNYLINILCLYLKNEYIDLEIFMKIIYTCLPFDKKVANDAFQKLKKQQKGESISIYINGISFENYEEALTGEEKMILENLDKTVKIELLSKHINWYLDNLFLPDFESENYMLCICFPENTKYNCFNSEEMKESVDKFFNIMMSSPPMKQAMIIDSIANKYKYFFNNEDILKEFNDNVHIAPLPFSNYYGHLDKKSFDIYINASYKTDNEFIKILDKYNQFFMSKAHLFKSASQIYLRMFNNNINIKTSIKNAYNFKNEENYINQIINNTEKIINIQAKINSPNISLNSIINEYGELLELSLFGYKYNILFFKSIIFILSESSWNTSPENFYENFCNSMLNNKFETLELLCKEPFLKKLLEFYDFSKKENAYNNFVITKDSKGITSYYINKSKTHYGLREINRGRKINEQISIEDIKKNIEKRRKNNDSNDKSIN